MKWNPPDSDVQDAPANVLPEVVRPSGASGKQHWLLNAGIVCIIGFIVFAAWNSFCFLFSLYWAASGVVAETSPAPTPAVVAAPPVPILPPFLAKFKDHLITLSWGQQINFDYTKLAGVDYVAFYYSASWCPPCRAFTPRLVSFYRDFKARHPNFELIFVNHDRSEEDMLSYMRTDSMPWPAIRFADVDDSELRADDNCGPGIPSLCLLDSHGRFLAGSYDGSSNYVPPDLILEEIRRRVP